MPHLSCRVCSKPAGSQIVLPCGHHFCDRCIQLWLSLHCPLAAGPDQWPMAEPGIHFPCQLCWSTCTVPPGGLGALRHDDTGMLATLVNQMEGMSMATGNTMNANEGNQQFLSNKNFSNQGNGYIGQGSTGLYDPSLLRNGTELACTPTSGSDMMTEEGNTMQVADEAPSTQQTMIQQSGSGYSNTTEYDTGRRYCFPSCHTYQYHLM